MFWTGFQAKKPTGFCLRLSKIITRVLSGIIGSLGRRRVEAAVPYFEKLLKKGTSPAVTAAILEALGNLDSTEAGKLLKNYVQSPDEKIRLAAVDSMVRMAQRQIKRK